jgi:hypothetical protein
MTPNDLDVLIHYHAFRNEHPHISSPAVRETIDMFRKEGILEMHSIKSTVIHDNTYFVTDKGLCLIEMLCNTPFPVAFWRDPRE